MPSKKWMFLNTLFLALIMCTVFSICLPIGLGQSLSIGIFGFAFGVSFISTMIVASVIPLGPIGGWFSAHMGAEPHSGIAFLLECIIQVAIFLIILNLIMTLAMTGVAVIEGHTWFDRWWGMNMQFYGVAFIAFCFARTSAEALATKCCASPAPKESSSKETA